MLSTDNACLQRYGHIYWYNVSVKMHWIYNIQRCGCDDGCSSGGDDDD